MVSQDGNSDVLVTCPAGYWATGGGCNGWGDTKNFHYSFPAGEAAWSCRSKGGPVKASVFCTNMFKPVTQENREYDWAYAWCPRGYRVTGGGCFSEVGSKWQEATPAYGNDGKQGYVCGGHGGWKNVVAICTDFSHPTKINGGGIGGDWETPTCDEGWAAVGGGCRATNGVQYFQASQPATNGWNCGGHNNQKQVKAVCMKLPETTTTTTTTTTQCTSCNLQFKYVKSSLPSSNSFETYSDYTLTVPNTCAPTQHIENYKFPHVPLTLLMKFKSPYSGKTARNVVFGDLFQLNLQTNSTVTIEFQLVDSSINNYPIQVDEVVMSVLDLDTSGAVHQRVRAHGFKAVRLGDGVKRVEIAGRDSPYLFHGTNPGDHTNNPSNAMVLSPEQLKNTMSFAFVKTSSWEITFEVTEGTGGRNFLLGGASKLMPPLAHC